MRSGQCSLQLGRSCRAEDSLEQGLLKQAPKLIEDFKKRGYKNIGVLKFQVQHEGADFDTVGTFNLLAARRLERALIGFMLDRCDQEAVPAYLEASSPENVPFYRRHGFEVTQDLELKNGPTVWGMWREPR